MKIRVFTFAAILMAGVGHADEVLVLADGSRLTVRAYEVKDSLVIITTSEGKLRSLPRQSIDLEATQRAAAAAPAAAPETGGAGLLLPVGRLERIRWVVDHYGQKALFDSFSAGFEKAMEENRGTLPPELPSRLRTALREAAGQERVFEEAAQELVRRAPPETLDAFLSWLDSSAARSVLSVERWKEGGPGPTGPGVNPVTRRLAERFEEATGFAGNLFDMYSLILEKYLESFRASVPEVLRPIAQAIDPGSAPMGKREDLQVEQRAYLERAYSSVRSADLEAYVRYWESPDGRAISSGIRSALLSAFSGAGSRSGRATAEIYQEWFSDPTPAPESSKFEKLNFQFTPRPGWASFDVKHLGPAATIGFLRSNPSVYFLIVTEDLGEVDTVTSEAAASVLQANLETRLEQFRLISEAPRTLRGMEGVLFASEARLLKRDVSYLHWVHANRGIVYQLAAWGFTTEVDRERLESEAMEMFSGFELLEPTPLAASEEGALGDYSSETFGYGIRLAGAGWSRWEELSQKAPEADHGGLLGQASAFIVIPVHLGSLSPSMEALTGALLARLNIDSSSLAPGSIRLLEDGSLRGSVLDYEREIDGTPFNYRLRVIRTKRFGYLAAAWNTAGNWELLDDLHSRFYVDPDHELPEDAVLPDRLKIAQALILNDIGIDYYDRQQYGSGSECFDRAVQLSPEDPVMLTNLMSTLTITGRFEEALQRLDRASPQFADNLELQSYRPFLFAKGYQNDDDLSDYAELLLEMERQEEAIEAVESYRKTRDSISAARLAAALHGRLGRHDRRIALLLEKHRAFPSETRIALDLLDAYLDAERPLDAEALAASLIEKSGPTAALHFRKGQAELALGRHAESKTSFQAALDLDPTFAEAREYLDHVSALMGQGDQEPVRRPIEPVPIPDHLASIPAPLQEPVEHGAYYRNRVTAISFRPNEDYRVTERYSVRITDPKALTAFSSFQFELDPLAERLYVNELRVLDAEGNLAAEGDPSTYYVTDDTSEGTATEDQILTVPVPGLEPGGSVELTVTWQRRSPPGKMPFRRHTFSSGYPVQRGSLYVSGAVDAVRFHGENVSPPVEAAESLSWTEEAPPVYRAEGFAEAIERYLPFVWLGDREASWESVGRKYLEDIHERLTLDPEATRLAESLVEGLETREERIQAISDYVQKSYTYKAIEFGRRAWLPNPVPAILKNKYGDCKDHALLFHSLLRAIDEPSVLVLISASSEIQPSVPSLDQFDHMIVYSSGHRGGHFFDLTDKNHDVTALPPVGLGGKAALLLDPENPRLVELPPYPDHSSRIRSERKVSANGLDLVVEEVLTLDGYYGAWVRAALKDGDTIERRKRIQEYLQAGGSAVLEDLEAENVAEPREPLVLRVRYRIGRALQEADRRLVGRIPALWEKTFFDMTASEVRLTPYRVQYPLSIESEVTVAVPPGYRIATAPQSIAVGKTAFAPWKVTSELTGEELVLRSQGLRPSRRGSAEEYDDLARTMAEFLNAAQPSLVLARTQTTPAP